MRFPGLPCWLFAVLLAAHVWTPVRAATRVAKLTLTGDFIRIQPATVEQFGRRFSVAFSTADDGTLNGELGQDGGTDQYTTLAVIEYPGSEALGPARAFFSLKIPLAGDLDANGVTDFLEVRRAIAGLASKGDLEVDDGMEISRGTVAATWTRAAGSSAGTVEMKVSLPDYGIQDLVFSHAFEVFQYSGTLSYEVVGTNVTASVDLPRLGGGVGFKGAMPMGRLDARTLFRYGTTWKGPGGFDYGVLSTADIEGVEFPVDYITHGIYGGVVVLADGDPSTPFPNEFDYFDLIVEDPNDADGDTLPDLTDPSGAPPPRVSFGVSGGVGVVRVSGPAGARATVESRRDLGGAGWAPVGEVVLDASGAGQVGVGVPLESAMFFRARVP